MDQIAFPADVPPELKAADLLLKRAKELKLHDPVMCYWCCYRAAQIGVADKQTHEGTMVLLDLLDALEKMKALLKDNDAVTNELAGQAYAEDFALRVFTAADDEDRAGRATPATVRKFLAAATFLEVGKAFGEAGELESEMEAKLKYARYKAASLAKAFKAGVKPHPGPPGWEPPAEGASSPTAVGSGEEEGGEAGTWSVAATPGAVLEDHAAEQEPSAAGPDGFPFAAPNEEDVGGAAPLRRKSSKVRFEGLGPDVSPGSDIVPSSSSPEMPAFPEPPSVPSAPPAAAADNEDEGKADGSVPSAPSFVRSRSPSPTTEPTQLPPPTQPISPDKPRTIQVSPLPPSNLAPPPQPPSFPSASTPSPTAPPAAAPPKHKTAPPPPAPDPADGSDEPLSLAQIEKIQKHAKWAISALNYEDVETARKELREALRLLG